MRTPFIATVALCSGLGKSGVGGKCCHCCPWAEDARVMASSKMKKRRQNHMGCFDMGPSRTVPSQLTDLELSVLHLPRKYTVCSLFWLSAFLLTSGSGHVRALAGDFRGLML